MAKGLLGQKIGMLNIWTEDGKMITVTAVKAGPCPVVQVKSPEKDGYSAIQIGYGELREKAMNLANKGHQKALVEKGIKPVARLFEIADYPEARTVGDVVDCSIFNPGDKIFVRGTSKGKGFAGVVKRYKFHGGRMTHGSKFHRAPGSIGNRKTPGEVMKGKRMPGHKGAVSVTVKNMEIVRIIPEDHVILLKGAVPGVRGSSVYLYQHT